MADEIHKGRCACGKVSFETSGQPVWTAGCCCRDCSRATGTPYVVWVGFPISAIRFETAPEVAETSRGVLRGYCPSCGTSLTYGRDPKFDVEDPLLYVSASALDDPEAFLSSEMAAG